MNVIDLLLHPVRLRVIYALSGGRALSTGQLCAHLSDVPKVTMYRQVGLLTEGGVLEVAREQRVRGAVERYYRLRQDRPVISADDAASMSIEDHRRGFAAAMAVLISEFDAYLRRDGANPVTDSVGYRQTRLWLSPDELADMIREMSGALLRRAANEPAPDRTPYLLSPIIFPAEQPAED